MYHFTCAYSSIQMLDTSIEVAPADASLLIKRGVCFRQMKMFPAAVKDFLSALKGEMHDEAELQLSITLVTIADELHK